MTNVINPVINVTELEQVGFAVHNVDKSMEQMWNTFGIGPWNILVMDPYNTDTMTYYGKPARFSVKIACTQKKLGGMEIELLEPIAGDNIYADFLKDHGEGLHHLGWHKVDSLQSFQKTFRELEKAGFPCMMSGASANFAFGYFDTTKVLNTLLEVLWVQGPPPPYSIFPK